MEAFGDSTLFREEARLLRTCQAVLSLLLGIHRFFQRLSFLNSLVASCGRGDNEQVVVWIHHHRLVHS